ncbi:MAG: hypothetical protein KDB55_21485 [Mycobacterium sp.]|nr:hypothetical protein [Mycobacterium sp.]MCB0939128.1 hypothetical protein [Mycobacterium sp.]
MTLKTTISLDDLWKAALPEVIEQLRESGYTVEDVEDDDSPQAAIKQLRPHQTYRLEPGPAALTAVASPADAGSIQFVLTGPRFGLHFGTEQADPVLWMRLVTLGVRLRETYMVVPSVIDPDFVIGGTGSRGSFLPS